MLFSYYCTWFGRRKNKTLGRLLLLIQFILLFSLLDFAALRGNMERVEDYIHEEESSTLIKNSTVNIIQDKKILSEKNYIIKAKRFEN